MIPRIQSQSNEWLRYFKDSQTLEDPESVLKYHPRQRRKQLHHRQLPEKERLLQKTLENKTMVFMLHKEQEGSEEDIAHQIRSRLVILSSWNMTGELVRQGMT